MSKHSQPRAGPPSGLSLAVLGAGAMLTGAAWLFLVGAAIDFGVLAVHAGGLAWAFTLGASLGAVVCLILMLTLVARAVRALGFESEYQPRRAAERPDRRSAGSEEPTRSGRAPADEGLAGSEEPAGPGRRAERRSERQSERRSGRRSARREPSGRRVAERSPGRRRADGPGGRRAQTRSRTSDPSAPSDSRAQ